MQFNREEYLNGNYDLTNNNEIDAATQAKFKSDLAWNMYISNYVLFCLREDLMSLPFSKLTSMTSLIPLLQLGMFNTAGTLLTASVGSDDGLDEFRYKWIDLFAKANDIDPDTRESISESHLTNKKTSVRIEATNTEGRVI